jgi:hypothetical protein
MRPWTGLLEAARILGANPSQLLFDLIEGRPVAPVPYMSERGAGFVPAKKKDLRRAVLSQVVFVTAELEAFAARVPA